MSAGGFRSDLTRRFADYWFSLPKDGLLPPREAFNPAAVPELLPTILLRDVMADGQARYRLAGTAVRDMLGFELTGLKAFELMPATERDRYQTISRLMFEQPCGVWALLAVRTDSGHEFRIENVAFPFAPRADGGRRTVGSFVPLDRPRQAEGELAKVTAVDGIDFIDLGAGMPDPVSR